MITVRPTTFELDGHIVEVDSAGQFHDENGNSAWVLDNLRQIWAVDKDDLPQVTVFYEDHIYDGFVLDRHFDFLILLPDGRVVRVESSDVKKPISDHDRDYLEETLQAIKTNQKFLKDKEILRVADIADDLSGTAEFRDGQFWFDGVHDTNIHRLFNKAVIVEAKAEGYLWTIDTGPTTIGNKASRYQMLFRTKEEAKAVYEVQTEIQHAQWDFRIEWRSLVDYEVSL